MLSRTISPTINKSSPYQLICLFVVLMLGQQLVSVTYVDWLVRKPHEPPEELLHIRVATKTVCCTNANDGY